MDETRSVKIDGAKPTGGETHKKEAPEGKKAKSKTPAVQELVQPGQSKQTAPQSFAAAVKANVRRTRPAGENSGQAGPDPEADWVKNTFQYCYGTLKGFVEIGQAYGQAEQRPDTSRQVSRQGYLRLAKSVRCDKNSGLRGVGSSDP